MNQTLLYQWIELVRTQFTNLNAWQATNLALFSFGVVLAEHCRISKVAEGLAFFGRITSLERRLRRWLANPRFDLEACWQVWIGWVWKSLEAPRAVLLVDETRIGARWGIMMVSLAYERRAIPLVWRCYRANSAEDYPHQGQVLMIWGLLARVLEALPAASRPVVQMDRGLGHSSAMIKALQDLKVDFLIRVKQEATFTSRRGHACLLRELIHQGERVTCHGTLFRYSKRVTGTVHLIWEKGQKEPWCLFTTDAHIRGSAYALRMWQEESFRDLKSGGWQWQCTYVTSPDHAHRLVFVLALAYAWMLTQGTLVLHGDSAIQREVFDGRDNKYSLFRSGLRYFKRMAACHLTRIYVGLFFMPAFKPLC
jgi:hypothetical protein